MTRGDQRERDRAKALKAAGAGKNKKTGNPQARFEADAKAVADKVAAKAAAKAAAESGAAPAVDPKSKVGLGAKMQQKK